MGEIVKSGGLKIPMEEGADNVHNLRKSEKCSTDG
jgi:hypothetical protein